MGGSSSQTIGQRYFAKLTTFIGNPIEKLIGINFDNRGWIFKPDNDETFLRVESPNLYGDKEGGVAGFIDIHTGTADQLPNTTYSADFPKVSGYPFQSYLLFRGLGKGVSSGGVVGEIAGIIAKRHHYNKSFYHGNSGYMKEMLLWPQRVHVRNDGRPQWYNEKAEINAGWVKGSAAYDFNGLTWEFGAETSTTNAYPNIEKVAIVEIYDEPDKIHTVNIEFEAFVEMRPVIGGEVAGGENGEIVKGGEYDVGASAEGISYKWFNRYTLEISDPPQIYYLNNGTAVNGGRSSFSGNFSVQVRNGATITAKAETGDPGYTGTINGYWQYIKFKAKGENGKYADINPIHKIREILTDDTAMNKPESDINDVNFKKAADVIYTEKLGISWSVTEKSCLEAINELCGHIEAGVRMNRQTGLYEMVLFRDDWFDDDEIHTLPVNKIKGMQLDGATSADELINKLNVSYYNQSAIKNSSFSIAENAAIRNLNGHENSDDVKFPYFMHQRNAAIVSQWKLKQVSTPVWRGTFTTGFYQARKWNRYDLLRLEWPRRWSGTILVRIMKINLGTGTDVSIDFVEVVPYSGNLSSNIVNDTPVDTTPKPPLPALFKAFELSYLEAVQLNGQKAVDEALAYNPDAGYAAVIAQRPQSNSLNALMYTDTGNDYERVGAIAYCETAELDQNISQINTSFIIKNAGDIDMVSLSTQITINQEIMVYQSYDDETGLLTVKRGALDTIPQNHVAGSVLYFADDFITVDPTEYVTGEIINVKTLTTTPSGILSLDAVDAQQVEIKARAIRPYPPANVKINNQYWPVYFEDDFTLTWSNRNRLQQTGGDFIGYFEQDVSLEENTQTLLTVIELDANNVELVTHSINATASNSFTLLESAMQVNARSIHVILKTVRDGYECLYAFDHIVMRSTLVAPSNVTFEVIEY
ncbi:hypothetical protein [Acinetobacter sp. MF4640]|uniref:hypothetical protein n=1 Tax=Acinetobacter sp. MF4640 TaxID=1960826 RepID=UPI000994AC39|nr:hypothetical protein [Acinetobacter sp. MF4640]OOW12787.1 hypothetical protein MF4640_11640 [Acinetobacter sp. MF4640]